MMGWKKEWSILELFFSSYLPRVIKSSSYKKFGLRRYLEVTINFHNWKILTE